MVWGGAPASLPGWTGGEMADGVGRCTAASSCDDRWEGVGGKVPCRVFLGGHEGRCGWGGGPPRLPGRAGDKVWGCRNCEAEAEGGVPAVQVDAWLALQGCRWMRGWLCRVEAAHVAGNRCRAVAVLGSGRTWIPVPAIVWAGPDGHSCPALEYIAGIGPSHAALSRPPASLPHSTQRCPH